MSAMFGMLKNIKKDFMINNNVTMMNTMMMSMSYAGSHSSLLRM